MTVVKSFHIFFFYVINFPICGRRRQVCERVRSEESADSQDGPELEPAGQLSPLQQERQGSRRRNGQVRNPVKLHACHIFLLDTYPVPYKSVRCWQLPDIIAADSVRTTTLYRTPVHIYCMPQCCGKFFFNFFSQ